MRERERERERERVKPTIDWLCKKWIMCANFTSNSFIDQHYLQLGTL